LVDDMQKKIDTLKSQLHDLEVKISQMDAEWTNWLHTKM
jgi:uncharacterized protein YukE